MKLFPTVLYDFAPAAGEQFQVVLHVNEKVEVHEESGGWFKGKVFRNAGPAVTGKKPKHCVVFHFEILGHFWLILKSQ